MNGNAVQLDRTGIRPQQSRQHRQQGRLAGSVRSDDGDEVTGLGVQGDLIENRAPAAPHGNLGGIQDTHEPGFMTRNRLARSATAASALSTTPQL